ncbi:MAG: serine hydrolase [Roseivirga sp.]|nr:serine hydrolase [Roseivirga sp.]
MNRFVLISTLFILTGFGLKAQNIDIERIDKALERYVQNNNIPSLVVGIIKDGKLVHVVNKGEMKRESGIPADEKTGFQIASLSKSFTGLILNHMATEGLIDLDRTVASFMKEELNEEALKEFAKVTLIDVLQHRSGIVNNGPSVPPTPFGKPMIGGYSKEGFMQDLNDMKLDPERIGKFGYSNMGFGLLGYIAQKVSDKSYEALLQQYVLEPNRMGFTTSDLESVRDQLATPYMVGGDRTRETQAWEMGMNIPAGGILSNVEDLSKLMIAEMKAYQDYAATGKSSPYVLVENTKPLNQRMDYGYGFFKSRNAFDTTIVQLGHGGDVDGFGSHFEFYPEQNIGLVMLTGSGSGWFNDAKTTVESILLGLDLPNEIDLDKSVLKRYTGKYDFGKNQVMTITRRGNRLFTYFRGQDPVNLYASAENKFFYLSQNSQIEFELDKRGKITKTVYIQNGEEFYPDKIK